MRKPLCNRESAMKQINQHRFNLLTRLASVFALCAAMSFPAQAASTLLADVPLQGLDPVRPNIMFDFDDSGSMAWGYLPDYVADTTGFYTNAFCRSASSGTAAVTCSNSTTFDPPLMSAAINPIYYDPTQQYIPGVDYTNTSLPDQTAANTATWTTVATDPYGTAGGAATNTHYYAGTTSPVNLLTTFKETIWCNVNTSIGAGSANALTADNPANGTVCRRNGVTYAGTASPSHPGVTAGYNYPNPGAAANAVYKYPSNVSGRPYYYTIDNVQFCDTQDSTNGFGKGTCVARWDNTKYKYVRYFKNSSSSSFDAGAFHRYYVVNISTNCPAWSTAGVDCVVSTLSPMTNPAPTDSINNFANWYAYDSMRVNAMKTAASLAFGTWNTELNVGFYALNKNTCANNYCFLDVLNFNAANKQTWFKTLFKTQANSGTPTLDAMWRIGEYFSNNGSAVGLTNHDPLDTQTGACQMNYHLLATDGYWNETPMPPRAGVTVGTISDQDGSLQSPNTPLPPGLLSTGPTLAMPLLPPAGTLGTPFVEDPANAQTNAMSDIAMAYWIHDIRSAAGDFTNRVPGPIPWQHVNFYAMSLGAQGTIDYFDPTGPNGINQIISNAKKWPKPVYINNIVGAGPPGIDDLWHATINAGGGIPAGSPTSQFINASTPLDMAAGVVQFLNKMATQAGVAADIGVTGSQLNSTGAFGYKGEYNKGWTGDVLKYALNPVDGSLPMDANGNPLSPAVWSFASQLGTQAGVNGATVGWDTKRNIVSSTGNGPTTAGVPFRFANISSAQQASLGATASVQQGVLNFLRGDQSNEGVTATNFRARDSVLGDIVASQAVPVGPPTVPPVELTAYEGANPGYASFVSTYANRPTMIYVGANDGMLHAINDTDGTERWAYVPQALLHSGATGLAALSYRWGAIPKFTHYFYVNATPRIWDVDFGYAGTATAGSPNWRTILVGGLGKGGQAVYALDVTDPSLVTTEATAATKVKWEFSGDNDLGYVYDAPTLVKTYAYGWVALVASGYDSTSGVGKLFVINPTNGAVLQRLSTGVGTAGSPSGLNNVRAFVASRDNPFVLQAYGGDLLGNVWRFDLSNPDPTKWTVGKFAQLTDTGGVAQPITTGIRIEVDPANNTDRWVFVGTGKLLDQTDMSSTQRQTMYAIKDGTVNTPSTIGAQPITRSSTGMLFVSPATVTGLPSAPLLGWFMDAPSTGQQVVTNPIADVGIVAFAFSFPSSDPCAAVLSGNLYGRSYTTGMSEILNGGTTVASVAEASGIAGARLVQEVTNPGSTGVQYGSVFLQVTTTDGKVVSFNVNPGGGASNKHRMSWRIIDQ
jgi:type IV pilus assembly protein PilY1